MGDVPTTENTAAHITNQVLHALIFDVAVNAARAAIIAEAPIMGTPILDLIDQAALKYIAGKIYDILALGATFAIIDAQTSLEAKAANEAADHLKQALAKGNQDEINKAK